MSRMYAGKYLARYERNTDRIVLGVVTCVATLNWSLFIIQFFN